MIHPPDCRCVTSLGCLLRRQGGVQIDPRATPSRRRLPYRRPQGPSWEKGIAGETRPDGSFAPYLSPKTGKPMRVKEWSEGRHGFEKQIRTLKSDPNVFRKERETA